MTGATLLHRQISPSWLQLGRVTSQIFKPTPKDKGGLSVYDGGQINAEEAWRHYTEVQKLASVGVMSVRVDECEKEGLSVESDPTPYKEHVLIRFPENLSRREKETKAAALKAAAEARGWQYQA